MALCPLKDEWKSALAEHGGQSAMETDITITITGTLMKLQLCVASLAIKNEASQ